ncbi:MAG TPA: carbohydrate ABC transporter permease [Clostridia bacterium]|nr:carbohydrate ABC transporter permease [Clostridia bacterium]
MKTTERGRNISGLFLGLLGVFWIFPTVWLLFNSFKTDSDFITSFSNLKGSMDYLSRLWPRNFTFVNYIEMFLGGQGTNTTANMVEMFKNSFVVSICSTLLVVLITSLSAYAYERLDFPGGNSIFWTLMCLSMFPNVVNILPMFRIASALNWVNNLNALIWPGLAGVFNIFLLRNFLKGVPKDYDEAARIDGANSMQIYTRIIVPSMRPVFIVVGLFAFNGAWNDFLWPTIVMTDVSKQTLTAGLRLLMGQYEQKWAHMIASCIVSMIPPFLLYLVAQRYFLQGISIGAGIKG